MRAFKGFNKDLTCRGYQYEEPHLLQGIKEPHLLVILLV